MPQAKPDYAEQMGLKASFPEGRANIQSGGTRPPHMPSHRLDERRLDRPGHSREHSRFGGVTHSDGGGPFQPLAGDMSQKKANRVVEIAHAPLEGLKTPLIPTHRLQSDPPPLAREGFPFSGLQLLADGKALILPLYQGNGIVKANQSPDPANGHSQLIVVPFPAVLKPDRQCGKGDEEQ